MHAQTPDCQQAILQTLKQIRDLLQKASQQSSCRPCGSHGASFKTALVPITTTVTKILGVNPRRLSFTIANIGGTQAIRIAPQSNMLASSGGVGLIPAGQAIQFTAYQFPATLTGDWYAVSASGTMTPRITEDEQI